MHDETEARGEEIRVPSHYRPGPLGPSPCASSGRRFGYPALESLLLVALTALPTMGAIACQAGELNERQERYLRNQLDQHYPKTASESTQQPSATGSSSSQAAVDETVDETSGVAGPSSPDVTTSVSSAPAAASSETSANPVGGEIPACALQTFQTACAGNACHYQGAINLPPNFETTEDLFTMLTTAPVNCPGAPSPLYIDVESPQNSYLLVKIRGEQPAGCGTAMPPPGGVITQQQIDCLEGWIGSL